MTYSLYCIPYAGGNAYAYRPLEAHLPGWRLTGIELPGRGRRAREALQPSLEALADDVFAQIAPGAQSGPYLIFGHSMGAALAYLCLHRLHQAGLPLPRAVVLSGKRGPFEPERKIRHKMPQDEFMTMLRELGGCPPEILQEAELMAYFEPILRSDFQAVETWQAQTRAPLPVPLVVLWGRDDEVSREEALAWARETAAGFSFHEFDGDHFFIQRHWSQIAEILRQSAAAPTAG